MLAVIIKHGPRDVVLQELQPGMTVAALKERVEDATGVFVRNQKLIFKGRVLEDSSTLEGSRLTSGAKLMLLASAGGGGKQAHKPSAAAAAAAAAHGRAAKPGDLLASAVAARAGYAAAGGLGSGVAGGEASAPSAHSLAGTALEERRANWGKMGALALRDQGLAEVPPACFEGLPGVRSADLSQNRLAVLPGAVSLLTGLASLRLGNNRIADDGLPWSALASLRGLTALALDRNALTALPAALGACSALVRLSAAHNAITAVEPGALGPLAALRQLDLAGNALTAFPDDVGECCCLEDLEASANRLATVPTSITALTRLQSLRLDSNRVKALPAGLFERCCSLSALLLRGNPITVDALRAAPGFDAYEARRRARADKQLGGRVMSDLGRAFCEGADVAQWQHFKPT